MSGNVFAGDTNQLSQNRYGKNPYIRTLNFEGQASVGCSLMITISNIRLLGS